jgi:hypothetical protein
MSFFAVSHWSQGPFQMGDAFDHHFLKISQRPILLVKYSHLCFAGWFSSWSVLFLPFRVFFDITNIFLLRYPLTVVGWIAKAQFFAWLTLLLVWIVVIFPLTLATWVHSTSHLLQFLMESWCGWVAGLFFELLMREYHTYRIVALFVLEETPGCV